MTSDHYFTAQPAATAAPRVVSFEIGGQPFRLQAAGGVFSASRLDPGTAVLLRKAPLPSTDAAGPLLDLGCGYGPVAIVLAHAAPAATVYAVDVNRRALDLVEANAASLGVADRIVALTPGDVPPDVTFREIWSNPPIRIGKAELHAMLLTWLPRLAPGGVAWLVVARHLGADSLQGWLIEQGMAVRRHASQKGYRILRVENPATADAAAEENG
ncbi:MAG TPA: methyltransferase [Micromonosporaceae bacterium]|nr:methyltransferase [Micromonosporaceae bacterium]